MVCKVFISYRRDDSAGHAGRVYDRLEREFGRDLLVMDVDSIPLGANFVKVLDEEVVKCDVLLAIIGPGWFDARDEDGNRRLENPDDFVRIEIATALKRDVPVIPILLEGTRIPKADQLPDDLKELTVRNALNVRHVSFLDDMERLIRGLKRAQSPQQARIRRARLPAAQTEAQDHDDRHQSAAGRSGGRIVNVGDDTVGNVITTGAKAGSWLDFAPKPDTLPADKKWHVFLSYRSVHRPWVLALYDILNLLGYKVFLDQYALTAATPLASSLGDALNASAGAIMIWSGSYGDSEWCKQEFAKLETRQNAKRGFRYIIARIDESEIPGLAATKLWIDFSKQRDGPAGSGLLSLLYGLKGQPLPPEVIKLAAEVDAQMTDGLLSVEAARYAGDADALVALAETDDMAWTGSPMLLCSVAEELIAMKKIPEAITVLDRVEAAFPKATRPKQLRGLALARSGQTMKAQLVLWKLYVAGAIDPETLGILARTWMDRYIQSSDPLFLLKSRDLYRQAFEAYPSDYYTGISAASTSLLAGEKETAAQLAARVQEVVGDKPAVNDYRMTVTAAELQLLQARYPEAAALYRDALVMAPFAASSHESTHAQAKLLSQALGASDEQRALIDAAFR